MPYFLTIAGVVLVVNFFMFFMRRRKGRDRFLRLEHERMVAERESEKLRRQLQREQVEFARRVELQNKTFDMYEQVRRKWAAIEEEEGRAAQESASIIELTNSEPESASPEAEN